MSKPIAGTIKRVEGDREAVPIFPTEPDATNATEIETFKITRVVEFDGEDTHDRGITIEFFGSDGADGRVTRVTLDSEVASALMTVLSIGGV